MDEGKTIRDVSFVVKWNEEIIIGFRGFLVSRSGKTDLVAGEVSCISIERQGKIQKKAQKEYYSKIDEIISKVNGVVYYRDYLVDGSICKLSRYLLRKGAEAKPVFTRIINLYNDEKALRADVRKSYTSLINWGVRELQIKIFDSTNTEEDLIDNFRELHLRESGRATRSLESWRRQYECLLAGEAFIVAGYIGNQMVTAGYFTNNKNNCYYHNSASRRDLFDKPLFHSLMWTAVLHAKKIGCNWFEVGEQYYRNQPINKHPSKKELDISEFKAGFGGDIKTFLDFHLDCS